MRAPCSADPPSTPRPGLEKGSGLAPRQGGGAEHTGWLPGESAEPGLHRLLSNPVMNQ